MKVVLPGASSRTHMLAGAETPERPPSPPFPLSSSDAFNLAAWYLRYALDGIGSDPRCALPAVRTHAKAALAQHDAIANALKLPEGGVMDDKTRGALQRYAVAAGELEDAKLSCAEAGRTLQAAADEAMSYDDAELGLPVVADLNDGRRVTIDSWREEGNYTLTYTIGKAL